MQDQGRYWAARGRPGRGSARRGSQLGGERLPGLRVCTSPHVPSPEPLDDFIVHLLKARKPRVIDVTVGGKGLDLADPAAPDRLLCHEVDLDLAPIDAVHRGEDPPALEPDPRLGRRRYDLANPERQLLKASIESYFVRGLAFKDGFDAETAAGVRLVRPGE